jgi:hypothetical protein
MKCGCEINCNNKPKHDGDRMYVSMMSPVAFHLGKLNEPAKVTGPPRILVEAIDNFDWEEIKAVFMDRRDEMTSAHEFVIDMKGTTIAQRRRAVLTFGVKGGRVPRCWLD